MKVKSEFVMRSVAGTNIVVPVGSQNVNFSGMLTLNDTGAFLWKLLETEKTPEELTAAIFKEYETDEATAASGVQKFIAKLREAALLDE